MQQGTLDLQGNGSMGFLGSDVTPLTLSVQNVDANILRVKLGASGRFEVPQSLFQNTGQGDLLPSSTIVNIRSPRCMGLVHLLSLCCRVTR